jgi:hypothetical protein
MRSEKEMRAELLKAEEALRSSKQWRYVQALRWVLNDDEKKGREKGK